MMRELLFSVFFTIVILYNRQIDASQPTRLAKAIDMHEWENVMRKQLSNTCTRGKSEPIWEGKMITESYCRCPDGRYGFDCTEQFDNPCPMGKTYHAADQSLANNYFIECMGNVPHLMKCPIRTIWNQKVLTCDWGRVRQGIPRQPQVVQQAPPADNYYDRKNAFPTLDQPQLVQSPVQVQNSYSSYSYDQPQQQQQQVESAPVLQQQQQQQVESVPVLQQQPVQQTYTSYEQSYSYPSEQKLADVIVTTTPVFNLDLSAPQTQTYQQSSYTYSQPEPSVQLPMLAPEITTPAAPLFASQYNSYEYSQPSHVETAPVFEPIVTSTTASYNYPQAYDYASTTPAAPVVMESPISNYQNSYSYDQYAQSSQAKVQPVTVETTTQSQFFDIQSILDKLQALAPATTPAPVVKEIPVQSYNDNSYSYAQPVQSSYDYTPASTAAPVVNEIPAQSYNYPQPAVQSSYSYDYTPATTAAPVVNEIPVQSYNYPQPAVQKPYSYDYTPATTAAPVVNEIPAQSYNYPQPAVQSSYSYEQVSQAKIVEPVTVQTTTQATFFDLQPILDKLQAKAAPVVKEAPAVSSYYDNSYNAQPAVQAIPVQTTTLATILDQQPVLNQASSSYYSAPSVANSYDSYGSTTASYAYAQPSVEYGQVQQGKVESVPVQTTTLASVLSQPANSYAASASAYGSQESYYSSPSVEYNVYTAPVDSYGYLSKSEADSAIKTQIENKKSHIFDLQPPKPQENVAEENTVVDEEFIESPVVETTIVEAPIVHVNKKVQQVQDSSSIIVQTFNNSKSTKVASAPAITFPAPKPVSNILFQALPKLNQQQQPILFQQQQQYQQKPYQQQQYQQQPYQQQQKIPLQNNLLQSVIMPVQQQQRVQSAPIQSIQSIQSLQQQLQQLQQVQKAQPVQPVQPIQSVQQVQPVQQQQQVVQVTAAPVVKSSLNLIKLLAPIVSSSQSNGDQQAFKIDIPFDKSAADPNCQIPNGVSISVNLF